MSVNEHSVRLIVFRVLITATELSHCNTASCSSSRSSTQKLSEKRISGRLDDKLEKLLRSIVKEVFALSDVLKVLLIILKVVKSQWL